MWFKKYIVKKAGLCATRFQRFIGNILLCKLEEITHFGSQKMENFAYLRVLEISQNIVSKRNTWLLTSNPFTDKQLFWSTYLITGLLDYAQMWNRIIWLWAHNSVNGGTNPKGTQLRDHLLDVYAWFASIMNWNIENFC